MNLQIMENGINSLEVGLQFYNKFLDNLDGIDISVEHFGNLKFATIAFHNVVELFSKKILSDINELIIFDVNLEKDDLLCDALYRQYKKQRTKSGITWFATFEGNSYHTISYANTIEILTKIFKDEVNGRQIQALRNISKYRNALTHLGYSNDFYWYKILMQINEILMMVLKFYKQNIKNSDNYFNEELEIIIEETLKKATEQVHLQWMASNEAVIEQVQEILDELFKDENVKKIEVEQDEEYHWYKAVQFIYTKNDIDYKIDLEFVYSELNEAIFIVDAEKNIVMVISIQDENIKWDSGDDMKIKSINGIIPKRSVEYIEGYYEFDKSSIFGKQTLNRGLFYGKLIGGRV